MAPLLLIPQILFSEVICTLSGAAEKISYVVGCRWCCLAYGTLANINALPAQYDKSWLDSSTEVEWYSARYDIGASGNIMDNPALLSWMALALLILVFAAAAYGAVRRRREL